MAVAARSGASDARVPCPLCGGLIHPIAGKCKHCKADLTSYHAARPAATTPLPSLLGTRNGHSNGHSGAFPAAGGPASGPGHANAVGQGPITAGASPSGPMGHVGPPGPVGPVAPVAPVGPVGMMVAAAREASQPVLPPRPSYTVEARPSSWRSWPVVVIVLAIVAIVAALVLMAWPASRSRADGKHTLQPPPAPERMQTEPDVNTPVRPPPVKPPQGKPGPRAGATAPAPRDPRAPAVDPDDSPDDSPDDGSDDPDRSASRQRGGGIMPAMFAHLCRKLVQCGDDSDPMLKTLCEDVARTAIAPPANCPAAHRCLARIDTMSCSGRASLLSQLHLLRLQVQDCAEADRC